MSKGDNVYKNKKWKAVVNAMPSVLYNHWTMPDRPELAFKIYETLTTDLKAAEKLIGDTFNLNDKSAKYYTKKWYENLVAIRLGDETIGYGITNTRLKKSQLRE